ncbi:MAG: SPW repeat protein [Chloroflexota bacterium]
MQTARKLNWVILALGVWEIAAAFVLARWSVPVALWNALIVGGLIAVLAVFIARREEAYFDESMVWTIAGLSFWLIISPFALAYDILLSIAMWNDVVVGLVVLVMSLWAQYVLHKEVASQES